MSSFSSPPVFRDEVFRDKIAKLMRLLASDHDAEVIAAVRALQRGLESEGADMNDLADLIFDATATGTAPSSPSDFADTQNDHLTRNSSLVSCSVCTMHESELTAPELSFVRTLEARLKDGRSYTPADIDRLTELSRRFEKAV